MLKSSVETPIRKICRSFFAVVWIVAATHAAASPAVVVDLLFNSFDLVCVDSDGQVQYTETVDGERFDGIGRATLTTDLIFIEAPATFEGVRLAALAALCEPFGIVPEELTASALNDYVATIPATDWRTYDVIVADLMNGAQMSIVDKGPFWIIYPVSDHSELASSRYNERMVWQLRSLEFRSKR